MQVLKLFQRKINYEICCYPLMFVKVSDERCGVTVSESYFSCPVLKKGLPQVEVVMKPWTSCMVVSRFWAGRWWKVYVWSHDPSFQSRVCLSSGFRTRVIHRIGLFRRPSFACLCSFRPTKIAQEVLDGNKPLHHLRYARGRCARFTSWSCDAFPAPVSSPPPMEPLQTGTEG